MKQRLHKNIITAERILQRAMNRHGIAVVVSEVIKAANKARANNEWGFDLDFGHPNVVLVSEENIPIVDDATMVGDPNMVKIGEGLYMSKESADAFCKMDYNSLLEQATNEKTPLFVATTTTALEIACRASTNTYEAMKASRPIALAMLRGETPPVSPEVPVILEDADVCDYSAIAAVPLTEILDDIVHRGGAVGLFSTGIPKRYSGDDVPLTDLQSIAMRQEFKFEKEVPAAGEKNYFAEFLTNPVTEFTIDGVVYEKRLGTPEDLANHLLGQLGDTSKHAWRAEMQDGEPTGMVFRVKPD